MVACSAQKEPPPRWWVFRGEGEESAIAADPERDCDESELEEMVTPTETKGGGIAVPCVPNQCERVLPLVNRLEPESKHTPVAGGIGPDIVGETPKTEPERETIRPSAFASSRKRRMVSRFVRSVDHEESAAGVSRPVVDSNVGQLQPIELPQFRHL